MILLQTMIMPIYSSGGSSGPWTSHDTSIAITIFIITFLIWLIANILTSIKYKISIFDVMFLRIYGTFTTDVINLLCYVVFACYILGILGYYIYGLVEKLFN